MGELSRLQTITLCLIWLRKIYNFCYVYKLPIPQFPPKTHSPSNSPPFHLKPKPKKNPPG